MKQATFIFINIKFAIINSFIIVDLGSLKINFDFFFIFILTIFDLF